MKIDRKLKMALIILLIILISIISFAGLYVQEKKSMVNILADYKLGMDLKGGRVISIKPDESKNIVYYDKDGNVVEEEDKNGSKKEVAVNNPEILTKENYIKTKEIIEKRLNDLNMSEYLIRQNENTGELTIQIPEDSNTDMAIQYIYTVGKITVEDENSNVFLDNSNIKTARVAYGNTESGTTVFLNIEFNKDSVEKLREITKNYLHAHEEGEEHKEDEETKKISIKIDGSELVSTNFDKEITNGVLSLSVGTASTNTEDLNSYLKQASNLAILIENGNFPITYTIDHNRYITSDINKQDLLFTEMIVGIIILLSIIVLTIVYKKNGLFAGIACVGYTALLLIIIRYTNVILTLEGIVGIIVAIILNYIFSIHLLNSIKKEDSNVKKAYNKTAIAMLLILVPALVVGVTLCFANWMPIYSFGEIIFWGIFTIFVYNTVITRTLLIYSEDK